MVSNQEQRALAVWVIDHSCVPPLVYTGFRLFVLPKNVQDSCCRSSGGQKGQIFACRTDPSAFRSAQPVPAPPPHSTPPNTVPPVVCLGWSSALLHFGSHRKRFMQKRACRAALATPFVDEVANALAFAIPLAFALALAATVALSLFGLLGHFDHLGTV